MGFLLRMSLAAKLLLLTLFAVLFFVGLFAYLGYHASNEATRLILDERLQAARTQALAIDQVLEDALRQLEHLAAGHLDLKAIDVEAMRAHLREHYAEEGEYFSAGMYLFDREGRLLLAEPETGAKNFVAEHIAAIVQGKSAKAVATIFRGTPPRPIACLAVPVRDEHGDIVGVVSGSMDLAYSLIGRFVGEAVVGATGYAELVDQDGAILLSQRLERVGRATNHVDYLTQRIEAQQAEVSRCHSCHAAGAETARKDEILAFAPLSEATWGVALRQTQAEAFHIARDLMQRTYLLGGITLVVALLAVLLTIRLMVNPVRSLTRSLERIGGGKLDEPIPFPPTQDEIGTLARVADEMRVALKQAGEERDRWEKVLGDTVEEKTQDLEQRVRELDAVNRMNINLLNERVEIYEQAERRLEQFQRLHSVAMRLTVTPNLEELLRAIVAEISQVVASDYTSIVLAEKDGALGRVAENMKDMPPLDMRARPGGMTRTILATGEPIHVADVPADRQSNPILVSAGIKSLVGLPIRVAGRVRGVLFVHSLHPNAFAQDIEVLTLFADWAGQAIQQLEPTQGSG